MVGYGRSDDSEMELVVCKPRSEEHIVRPLLLLSVIRYLTMILTADIHNTSEAVVVYVQM